MKDMLKRVLGADSRGGVVGRFIRERCEIDMGGKALKEPLYFAYQDFCKDKGINAVTPYNHFFREIYQFFPIVKPCVLDGGRAVKGITIRTRRES